MPHPRCRSICAGLGRQSGRVCVGRGACEASQEAKGRRVFVFFCHLPGVGIHGGAVLGQPGTSFARRPSMKDSMGLAFEGRIGVLILFAASNSSNVASWMVSIWRLPLSWAAFTEHRSLFWADETSSLWAGSGAPLPARDVARAQAGG